MTTIDESLTFRKLKQLHIDTVLDNLDRLNHPSSCYALGNVVVPRAAMYHDISLHNDRIRIINECGWEYDEFVTELEKRAIIFAVNQYNNSIKFPQDIITRAKSHFPHMKFTEAKIEFE